MATEGNETEGSTELCNIVRPELPSIPFPVSSPVAEHSIYSLGSLNNNSQNLPHQLPPQTVLGLGEFLNLPGFG